MKVVFACAGSGGHINPAIAIANIIKSHEKDSEFLFIGTETGLENNLVKNAGFEIKHIRTGKILRSLTIKNVRALVNAYKGIGDAKTILKEFKPDLVIGTGGYICVPVMFASKSLKIPYILHESNAFPGVSVKLFAKKASKVMIGFEDAKLRLKRKDNVVYTGTPAKFDENKFNKLDKAQCKIDLKLDKINKKIVLVTCGSQGARRINEVVIDMIKLCKDSNMYFILVTGNNNYDDVVKMKKSLQKDIDFNLDEYIKIEKFVYEMDKMYKVSDVCVTRAGAMTITELALSSKPAILIPLPTATENHQLYNAKVLENVGGARILEQKDLTSNSLYQALNEVLDNNTLGKMSSNLSGVIMNDVEDKIYKCIKDVISR